MHIDDDRYAVVEDDENSPLIHIWVVGEPTEPAFMQYQDDLLAAFRRQPGRFAVIGDQGRLQFFPLRLVAVSVRWIKEAKREFGSRWVCASFVLNSPLLRRVMSAMVWASGDAISMAAFGTHEEAEAWSREQLAAAESSGAEAGEAR